MFPWAIKVFYGIISDTLPIFGSRKRNWLVLLGFVQFLTAFLAAVLPIKREDGMCALLFLCMISGAFMDVLVDAIMVIQARRDPENGS